MTTPLLVIISGPPCAGKTTLGKRLSRTVGLPFVNKDGIKETLFDSLGHQDRAWSRALGRASSQLLYYFAEAELAVGRSLIVESNFDPTFATPKLLALQARVPFAPLQIQCIADGEVLMQRFKARAEGGERHPGHVDHLTYDEMQPILLSAQPGRLEIGGLIVDVDTTDWNQIDHAGLVGCIRQRLARTEVG